MASNNDTQQISTASDSSPTSSDLSQSSSLQRITSLSVTSSPDHKSLDGISTTSSSSSPEHEGTYHLAESSPQPSAALSEDLSTADMGYKTLAEIDAGGDPSLELLNICNTAAHLLRESISNSLTHSNNDANSIEDCFNQKIEDLEKSITGALTQTSEPLAPQLAEEPEKDKKEEDSAKTQEDTPDTSSQTVTQHTTEPQPQKQPEVLTELPPTVSKEENNKASSESSKVQKKNQKNLISAKKKREKSIEQVLRSLHGLPTTDEKLKALCLKHTEMAEELKEAQAQQRGLMRSLQQVSREKEQLQGEHSRSLLARSRLESLCRELQRQNRDIKEESLARLREEEERRKELAAKFQTALQEMGTTVREQNGQLREENRELANRLKDLVAHYEAAEQHATRVVRQKEVEAQLHRAKFAKAGLELRQCQELHQRERQQLLATVAELQARSNTLSATEAQLRAELATYTDKYQDFQNVLAKSNSVFSSFKKDMDSMTKKIKKLEKETTVWKAKWEKSNATLMDMAADKQRRDQETVLAQNKITTLENLCRALQADRTKLREQLDSQSKPQEAGENIAPEKSEEVSPTVEPAVPAPVETVVPVPVEPALTAPVDAPPSQVTAAESQ